MRLARREPLAGSLRSRRLVVIAAIAVLVVLVDQVTKTLAVDHLTDGPLHVIGPFSFDLAYNTGVAFSLGTGLTLPIILVGLVIVAVLLYSARTAPSMRASVGIGLVLGGALGNLGDRLFRDRGGAVVDFIHTSFWPTFNVADSAVVIGCFTLATVFWRRTPARPRRGRRARMAIVEVPATLAGERLDRVVALLSGRSRSEVAALVSTGEIRLNGEVVRSAHRHVRAGEVLDLPAIDETPVEVIASSEVPFEVLYEDDSLIVVDKPAGVVVHPGSGGGGATLAAGLVARYPDLVEAARAGAGEPLRPGIVHRLDKETSGLLVVARTVAAFVGLKKQLTTRSMGRSYVAFALGRVEDEQGTIDGPIGRALRDRTRMAVSAGGREARTGYRVTRRFVTPRVATLLDLELETGRTHQIRVHLAAIGHPVAGDRRYGGGSIAPLELGRPFLHAAQLRLIHPTSGETLVFSSPLPEELARLLEEMDEEGTDREKT